MASNVQRTNVSRLGAKVNSKRTSPLPHWGSSSSPTKGYLKGNFIKRGTAIVFAIVCLLAFAYMRSSGQSVFVDDTDAVADGTQGQVNEKLSTEVPPEKLRAPKISAPSKSLGIQNKLNSSSTRTIPTFQGLYALHATDIDGLDLSLQDYAGKVLLFVNVASACGYTDQNYKGLQSLYEKYNKYGFEIIAFPSNQFGGQEPGSEERIKDFAVSHYNVTFKMMSKVDVNGPKAHPVFKYLKRNLPTEQGGGGGIGPGNDFVWNFNKILVDRQGRPVAFYYQKFDAAQLEADVFKFLAAT